jgi:hypothetical protein
MCSICLLFHFTYLSYLGSCRSSLVISHLYVFYLSFVSFTYLSYLRSCRSSFVISHLYVFYLSFVSFTYFLILEDVFLSFVSHLHVFYLSFVSFYLSFLPWKPSFFLCNFTLICSYMFSIRLLFHFTYLSYLGSCRSSLVISHLYVFYLSFVSFYLSLYLGSCLSFSL